MGLARKDVSGVAGFHFCKFMIFFLFIVCLNKQLECGLQHCETSQTTALYGIAERKVVFATELLGRMALQNPPPPHFTGIEKYVNVAVDFVLASLFSALLPFNNVIFSIVFQCCQLVGCSAT
jgi:hypothetical protein